MDNNYKIDMAKVIRQEEIAPGIYSLMLNTKTAKSAYPGQFAMIYPKDRSHLLGRPISICDMDKEQEILRFVYQVKGYGTNELSGFSSGEDIRITAPLGNGFPIEDDGDSSVIVGGGMGVAPMLALAKAIKGKATVVLGYRDEPFLVELFESTGCHVVVATESGAYGIKGTVIDAMKAENITADKVFTCGPKPMLHAVVEYTRAFAKETYVSLEERMACGIGACLGCVTKAKSSNDHYRVEKLCVCKDGPVFSSSMVEI